MDSDSCLVGLYVGGKCEKVDLKSNSFQIPKYGQIRSLRSLKKWGFKFPEEEKENYFRNSSSDTSTSMERDLENLSNQYEFEQAAQQWAKNESIANPKDLPEVEIIDNEHDDLFQGVSIVSVYSLSHSPQIEPEGESISEYNLIQLEPNVQPKESDKICDICDLEFSSPKGVEIHQNRMHKSEQVRKNETIFMNKMKFKEGRLKCPQCPLTFGDEEALYEHRNWVHLGIRFNCKFIHCEGSFPSNKWLIRHMKDFHNYH